MLTLIVVGYIILGIANFFAGIKFIRWLSGIHDDNSPFDHNIVKGLILWGFALWPGGLAFGLGILGVMTYEAFSEWFAEYLNSKGEKEG